MSFFKNIFKAKQDSITSYDRFWEWFRKNEQTFRKVVEKGQFIESDFFEPLSEKLGELREGFFYLTGMADSETVDLILTVDGSIKNIAFVEELVASAPVIDGWQIRALKPAMDIENFGIRMDGYEFKSENIHFYANNNPSFPDEIDVVVVHDDLNAENRRIIENGVYIFLDNFLGELAFVTAIDNLTVVGKAEANKELIPIKKLTDFLIWREKEFIEKYEGARHDTEHDTYSSLQAELQNGNPLIAIINTQLLNWDSKASHPWILTVEIEFNGTKNQGMPDEKTYRLLTAIEDDILLELKDFDGYLNIGRETAEGKREIYFACKEFRKPSKALDGIKQKYNSQINLDFSIYKDKYWRSLDHFRS